MKIRFLIVVSAFVLMITGCEKYDEYIKDYKYSAVYFATQKPLRTIVSYDEMQFKVGVALGGKRNNSEGESAKFEIDAALLDDEELTNGNDFMLLPQNYYSLSDDNTMNIPSGEFIGDVTVTLNKETFTVDPLSTQNNYALPIRITETSTDSILDGKDYTILVVKYISAYHGTYYHKGEQTEVDGTGAVVEQTVYNDEDLINNETWVVGTVDATTISTPAAGTFANGTLLLNVNEDNYDVTITSDNTNVEITSETGTYNLEDREFYLEYAFTRDSKMYQVKDTLVLRQAPERDLYFEEW